MCHTDRHQLLKMAEICQGDGRRMGAARAMGVVLPESHEKQPSKQE